MLLSQPIPLILASSSAIRQQLLRDVGLQFSVLPSGCDEDIIKRDMAASPIADRALALAKAKALSVSVSYPDHLTIGADQMCALGDTVLSKPGSYDNARAQLRALSGKSHIQHSAVAITRGPEVLWTLVDTATLHVRELTDAEIDWYVKSDAPLQSCGSYRLEGMGRHLFKKIDGNQDTIMGLPLAPVLTQLYALGAVAITA